MKVKNKFLLLYISIFFLAYYSLPIFDFMLKFNSVFLAENKVFLCSTFFFNTIMLLTNNLFYGILIQLSLSIISILFFYLIIDGIMDNGR